MNLSALEQIITKPIAFFDIEATGTDPASARIVSLSITKLIPGGAHRQTESWLMNPGVQMSDEVIAIHGIRNEAVATRLMFPDFAKCILKFIQGCDLGGFNLLNYDVPLLWEEFNRAGIKWSLRGVQIVDVGAIYKKKEERTLSAALRFYCGRIHEGAHGAEADVQATIDVLEAMLNRQSWIDEQWRGAGAGSWIGDWLGDYSDIALMDVPALAELSKFDDRVDLAGKIVRNEKGEPVYNFGNSKGTRVVDDPSFGRWMLQKDFSENTKDAVRSILYPQRELIS